MCGEEMNEHKKLLEKATKTFRDNIITTAPDLPTVFAVAEELRLAKGELDERVINIEEKLDDLMSIISEQVLLEVLLKHNASNVVYYDHPKHGKTLSFQVFFKESQCLVGEFTVMYSRIVAAVSEMLEEMSPVNLQSRISSDPQGLADELNYKFIADLRLAHLTNRVEELRAKRLAEGTE